MPLTEVLKFLISKGFTPTPDMTKSDLCLAFKSLVESQPDFIRPPVLPMQQTPMQHSAMPHLPMQQTPVHQTVPAVNNMLAISQNNNMMQYPAYQAPMQQVCMDTGLILYLSIVIIDNEIIFFKKHLRKTNKYFFIGLAR